jgi:ferritin-like metal-binding protein YciE
MRIDSLQDLFVYKLRQQYYVERTLVDALDEMAERANNGRMSQGFADHRDETRTQIKRLEGVFEALDVRAEPETDPVLDALEEERRSLERQIDDDDILDMVYLNAGLMTERVELTAYEGLSMLATELELSDDVHRHLESNHDEEQSAYRELNTLAAASEMKSLWDRLTPS